MTQLDEILSLLKMVRIRHTDEAMMQGDVQDALSNRGFIFDREFRIGSRDRIDFRCLDNVGIECKVSGSATAVLSQLLRYAECKELEALVLVTSHAAHRRLGRQATLLGKPFHVVFVAFGSI